MGRGQRVKTGGPGFTDPGGGPGEAGPEVGGLEVGADRDLERVGPDSDPGGGPKVGLGDGLGEGLEMGNTELGSPGIADPVEVGTGARFTSCWNIWVERGGTISCLRSRG